MRIGLLLFPDLTQLDLTGPAEVFGLSVDELLTDRAARRADPGHAADAASPRPRS